MDAIGLDLTGEDSSTLNMTLAWRGLVLMMEEVCLSIKFLRNFTCSVIGLCVKRPPTIMSRHRSVSMSIPKERVTAICYQEETNLGRRVLTLKIRPRLHP